MITVDTKLIALLGNPLRQSFSTQMQNAAYRAHHLDYEYFPLETTPETLKPVMEFVRCANFIGLGVTKPDKVRVMEYLDELDPLAERIGAVNTVLVTPEHKLRGYNTDGAGFLRSLQNHWSRPLSETAFFCLGAGGAGRAICVTLAAYGAKKLYISDLYEHSAYSLVEDINSMTAGIAELIAFEDKAEIQRAARSSQVIMNATGVGMAPKLEQSPVDSAVFHKDMLAFDATYNPEKTQFLKDAQQCGCQIFNGLEMLVYQGALQAQLWTGCEDTAQVMFKTLYEITGKHQE